MSLINAFNTLLFLHSREATIERPGDITAAAIKISPSNYRRNLNGPEEIVMSGREFVISKASLDAVSYPAPERGDRIKDSELGAMSVVDITEMFDLGGSIMGYRVRTE